MNDLFRDYFKHAKGQEPNEEIMELFAEILSEDENS
jgi:exonuclease SbcD